MTEKKNVPALVVGGLIGLKFPDFDLVIPLLLHRSIVTHSILVALVLVAVLGRKPLGRWFAAGISLALAVHFAFDLFPQKWMGFALVHVPWYGWTGGLFSGGWLLANLIAGQVLAAALLRRTAGGLAVGGATGLVLFIAAAWAETNIALQAFAVWALATWAILWVFNRTLKKTL